MAEPKDLDYGVANAKKAKPVWKARRTENKIHQVTTILIIYALSVSIAVHPKPE